MSATHAAVASGSVSDFRAARRAERAGQPLPDVPAPAATASAVTDPAAPAPAAPASPALSRRQQKANDATQRAVETATTTLQAENARLKAELEKRQAPAPVAPAPAAPPAPAPVAAAPAAPVKPSEPAYKKYAAMPDAPKLANFDSVEEHAAAMAVFVNEQMTKDRAATSRADAEQAELTAAQTQRVEKFVSQLHEARTADPEFLNKLSPTVRSELKPFAALKPGEVGGAIHIVGEQVYDSPIAPKVLLHFSQHPEELARLTTMPKEIAALPASARVKAHIQWIVRQYGALEDRLAASAVAPAPAAAAAPPAPKAKTKTLTDAPPQPEVVGSRAAAVTDPKTSAIQRGDTRAYREIRRQERIDRLSPRR